MLNTEKTVMNVVFTNGSLRNSIILSIVILGLFLAYEYLTRPGNYEDCVLFYLKSDASRFAVDLIDEACGKKFGH